MYAFLYADVNHGNTFTSTLQVNIIHVNVVNCVLLIETLI